MIEDESTRIKYSDDVAEKLKYSGVEKLFILRIVDSVQEYKSWQALVIINHK